jgi:hypothetical protein
MAMVTKLVNAIEDRVSYASICGILPTRIRVGIAEWMRKWADRLDDYGAPHRTTLSFTYEYREGIRIHYGKNIGCPLWYLGTDDYSLAFWDSETMGREQES